MLLCALRPRAFLRPLSTAAQARAQGPLSVYEVPTLSTLILRSPNSMGVLLASSRVLLEYSHARMRSTRWPQAQVAAQELQADPHQTAALRVLQQLFDEIISRNYSPSLLTPNPASSPRGAAAHQVFTVLPFEALDACRAAVDRIS